MRVSRSLSARRPAKKAPPRDRRPLVEDLEGRLLLASSIGQWTYSSRITFSFMPDGTNVGGTPSSLFQTFNAAGSTASWQAAIERAASTWEDAANLNLALVSDGGEDLGASGDQQDDPRFGDIRIGAVPLPQGVLAETYLPPPSNGGSIAGDIIFNSNAQWTMGGVGYDIQTVATHELGHALGLPDISNDTGSVMYYSYDGVKDSLDGTDVTDIQAIYGAPQYDQFNTGVLHNFTPITATNITPYLSGGEVALSGLDNTTPTDSEYYAITVPASNSGRMTVTLQSSNLSSLAPNLYILNSSLTFLASVTAPTSYGATLSASIPVSAGQKYYIKVATTGAYGQVGSYGLEVNFTTQSMPPIAPPNTLVADQPDQGSGGSTANAIVASPGTAGGSLAGSPRASGTSPWSPPPGAQWLVMGNLSGWAIATDAPPNAATAPSNAALTSAAVPVAIGPITSESTPAAPASSGTQGDASASPATPAVALTPSANLVLQAVDISLSAWDSDSQSPAGIDATPILAETS